MYLGMCREAVYYKQSLFFLITQQLKDMKEPKVLNRTTGSMLLVLFLIGIGILIAGLVMKDQGLKTSGFLMAFLTGMSAGMFVIYDILVVKFNEKDEEDEL